MPTKRRQRDAKPAEDWRGQGDAYRHIYVYYDPQWREYKAMFTQPLILLMVRRDTRIMDLRAKSLPEAIYEAARIDKIIYQYAALPKEKSSRNEVGE